MKKVRRYVLIIVGVFLLIGVLFGIGIYRNGQRMINNRYGYIVVYDGGIYYYANGKIFYYKDKKIKVVENAKTPYFKLSKEGMKPQIVYLDEMSTSICHPPIDLPSDDSYTRIAWDDENVYARYPGGSSYIIVYKIVNNRKKLKKIDIIHC